MSTASRRPNTALTPQSRMSYSDGEALLWERQNARFHSHLAQQLKDLQAQHDAYESRIVATEVVAEAAEAAVHQVRELEKKVRAIEEEERERPLDQWVKEAVGQLQSAVEGLKGVRGKISGLETKVDTLEEGFEGVKGDGELLRSLTRRVEVLEQERAKMREGRGDASRQPEVVDDGALEGSQIGVVANDNPLAVFYGIDTQPPAKRHHSTARPQQLPHRQCPFTGDLLPPDEEITLPEEGNSDLLEVAPGIDYGWENTQQFKEMQRELEELRAMCRSQDTKSSNNMADATQRPQETQIVRQENNMGFSDATTETEMETDDIRHSPFRMSAFRGQKDVLSSDSLLVSSPSKRMETQSARRKLMKRPSIYDPRVPTVDELEAEPVRSSRASLLVKLPVDSRASPSKVNTKRKHDDDAPVQRVVRPKLRDDSVATRELAASATRKGKSNAEQVLKAVTPALNYNAPAQPAPSHKTCDKQKPGVDRLVQPRVATRLNSRTSEQATPAAEPVVAVAESAKTRKAVSKPKPSPKKPKQQPALTQAAASSSKTSVVVKKEAKGTRQPNGACKSCRARHQKCDRTQPSCGQCAKGGSSCEYPSTSASAAPASGAASPKKKQALLPIKKAADEADRKHTLRERSVTVSPEEPREQSPAKRRTPALPSKKPTVVAAPTAASSRESRVKRSTSPQKKKQR